MLDRIYGVAISFVVLATLVFICERRRQVTNCRELVSRLHPHQLNDVMDLLEGEVSSNEFWTRTHGVVGLWKRWRNRTVFVQLAQEALAHGHANTDELVKALRLSKQLSRASFLALFCGLLTSAMPEVTHRHGKAALTMYAELAGLVHSLFADESAPLCANMIASLL